MAVEIRPATLQDGVAVLSLLEDVGYYPEPIAFAQTFRRTIHDPSFLVRVAESAGRIVGVATLSLRHHLGLGGLLACLDELAIAPGAPPGTLRGLQVRDSSRELGRLTTVAVVQSIFLVILVDALFAILFLEIDF